MQRSTKPPFSLLSRFTRSSQEWRCILIRKPTHRDGLSNQVWDKIATVSTKSLNVICWLGLGVSIAAFLGVAGEDALELKSELETDYGIDEQKHAIGGNQSPDLPLHNP